MSDYLRTPALPIFRQIVSNKFGFWREGCLIVSREPVVCRVFGSGSHQVHSNHENRLKEPSRLAVLTF